MLSDTQLLPSHRLACLATRPLPACPARGSCLGLPPRPAPRSHPDLSTALKIIYQSMSHPCVTPGDSPNRLARPHMIWLLQPGSIQVGPSALLLGSPWGTSPLASSPGCPTTTADSAASYLPPPPRRHHSSWPPVPFLLEVSFLVPVLRPLLSPWPVPSHLSHGARKKTHHPVWRVHEGPGAPLLGHLGHACPEPGG